MDMRTPLSKVRGLGSAHEGTDHFWQQRLTALANVPLAIFFIVVLLRLVGAEYGEARAMLSSPLVALLALLMVGSALYHMRIGMQVIIEDYIHSEALKLGLLILNTFFAIAVASACVFAILKLAFGG